VPKACDGCPVGSGSKATFSFIFDPNSWVAKNVALNAGELKIRLNNKWAGDFGADTTENPTNQLEGSVKSGGSNIKITTAGNYNVSFSFDASNKGSYKIEKL